MNFWTAFKQGFTFNRKLIQIISLSLIAALLFSTVILGSACKKKADTAIAESTSEQEGLISGNDSGTEANSDTSVTGSIQSSGSTAADTGSDDETSSESVTETATETTAEVIPQEITDLITEADNYYSSGEYALASKTYRDAKSAIENSDLTEETQQLQLNLFAVKYKKAKEITDTARLHYGNAKNLEYQQRFEEAKKEYEAALTIYPKYQDAINALDALKALMGLE